MWPPLAEGPVAKSVLPPSGVPESQKPQQIGKTNRRYGGGGGGWVVARTGGGFPRPVCPSLTSTTGPYPGCLVSQPPRLLTIPEPHQGAGGRLWGGGGVRLGLELELRLGLRIAVGMSGPAQHTSSRVGRAPSLMARLCAATRALSRRLSLVHWALALYILNSPRGTSSGDVSCRPSLFWKPKRLDCMMEATVGMSPRVPRRTRSVSTTMWSGLWNKRGVQGSKGVMEVRGPVQPPEEGGRDVLTHGGGGG